MLKSLYFAAFRFFLMFSIIILEFKCSNSKTSLLLCFISSTVQENKSFLLSSPVLINWTSVFCYRAFNVESYLALCSHVLLVPVPGLGKRNLIYGREI